jgi:DNA-binding MarR family transcriptional regulator
MLWSDRVGSRLKLRDLRVFMAVANAGTMGRAAADLAVSQPVISKSIADLEDALGVRLFDRSRRGVELTSHGQSLRDSGIAVFDELQQCVKRLEALTDPTAGEIRIGTTVPLATGLVSAAPHPDGHSISENEVSRRGSGFEYAAHARPARSQHRLRRRSPLGTAQR